MVGPGAGVLEEVVDAVGKGVPPHSVTAQDSHRTSGSVV